MKEIHVSKLKLTYFVTTPAQVGLAPVLILWAGQITGEGRYFCTDNFSLTQSAGRRDPAGCGGEERWEFCKEYVGEWVNSLREGVGVMTCKNGTVLQGVWVQDRFQAELYTQKIDKVRNHVPNEYYKYALYLK